MPKATRLLRMPLSLVARRPARIPCRAELSMLKAVRKDGWGCQYGSWIGIARHTSKDPTGASSPQRKLALDTVGPYKNKLTSVRGITMGSCNRVTEIIRAEPSMTEGADAATLHTSEELAGTPGNGCPCAGTSIEKARDHGKSCTYRITSSFCCFELYIRGIQTS